MLHPPRLRRRFAAALFACAISCSLCNAVPASDGFDPVDAALRTFAKSSVDSGAAVGVGAGIIINGQARYFSYGLANAATGAPFGPDLLFEIGSVTKVLTTNLFGQAIFKGELSLDTPLSAFPKELGAFKPLTSEVTLKELGDFTAGVPSLAPLCKQDSVPGCLHSLRPTPAAYDAQQFLSFFQNTVPKNYQLTTPKPVSTLPAPYFYSDFSVGLLGLILGAKPNVALSNAALGGWASLLRNRLLAPLGMSSTFLFPPQGSNLVSGYNQATGSAIVALGQVRAITLGVPGSGYAAPPKVTIKGGGGTGAQATAQIDGKGAVQSLSVTNGGHGYLPPPVVTFGSALVRAATDSTPKAEVIVANGKVAGVKILEGGSGYTKAPQVVISGGRRNGIGRDAKGIAYIANGSVSFIRIIDAGSGYTQPIAVIVKPGKALTNTVPVWAPAGALHSTIRDMSVFAAAASGQSHTLMGTSNPAIDAGFRIAQTPYACSGPIPDAPVCPAGTLLSALSWAIQPEDKINKVPAIILKNGGLAGFSTQVLLMPAQRLAVVVFVNSNCLTSTGEHEAEAGRIARNILYALFYQSQLSN
ncbi:MAG: serine hydrolase [Beijerinckiaceae bacterium]|nr:serine hydrolase [Beijerinckiaceae bacterium]